MVIKHRLRPSAPAIRPGPYNLLKIADEKVAHRRRIAKIELGMGARHEVLETRGPETTYQRRAQKTPMPAT
jgi:hypothetical protein